MPHDTEYKNVRDTMGRPVGDLRISVSDKCNLRCSYCMPKEIFGESYQFLKNSELLSFEDIDRIARAFVDLGVTKIRITGGEPLLRKNLPDLIAMLNAIDGVEDLALTTNGILLVEYAARLREAGLHRITVSLDSMDPQVVETMNGQYLDPQKVLAGIDAAVAAGFESIKINTVVQRGVNDHTLVDLARQFRGTPHILRFIEYMDVGNKNQWKLDDVVSAKEILDRIGEEFPLKPVDRSYRSEVASRYAYEDGAGEIGFISSVTNTFCGDCSRARISADGHLYTCLFSGDGIDLKSHMAEGPTNEQLLQFLSDVWSRREDRYSELRSSMTDFEQHQRKVEMYQIGG
jgi:cyclic pyranopterin phosphate synthase